MFKNSDNDSDTEVGDTCNGRTFKEVPLVNLFEQSHEPLAQDEGFYSGEEEELLNEEHSGSSREEDEKTGEPHREESETSRNSSTIEVSTITPPIVLAVLSNQSSQSYQSTFTSSSTHTQSSTLGRSMADEMRLLIFRGDGSEDPDQNWFLCEAVWSIKQVNDKVFKRARFSTTLRDRALSWYMKFVKGVAQPKPLYDIKTVLSAEFKKPKLESQCITEQKEIKQRVVEPVWEFDQRFKTLTSRFSFQIPNE
jgi:hypothetical protein